MVPSYPLSYPQRNSQTYAKTFAVDRRGPGNASVCSIYTKFMSSGFIYKARYRKKSIIFRLSRPVDGTDIYLFKSQWSGGTPSTGGVRLSGQSFASGPGPVPRAEPSLGACGRSSSSRRPGPHEGLCGVPLSPAEELFIDT